MIHHVRDGWGQWRDMVAAEKKCETSSERWMGTVRDMVAAEKK